MRERSFHHSRADEVSEEGKPTPSLLQHEGEGVWLVRTLEQLDTHLDPDQDNCQYVDTKCPLNCHMTIPKNKVEQHVAQHCAKRPYVCQHCPLAVPEFVCPKVTFEHDFMEDHMKMCRLQKVGCEFSGVGCDGWFIREDQEEHTRQNSQKHLTLTASLAVETKEQLQQKLLEQDKKHKEEEEKLMHKIEEQEKKTEEQDEKANEQEKKLNEHQKKLNEIEKRFQDQDRDHKEEKKMLKQILWGREAKGTGTELLEIVSYFKL